MDYQLNELEQQFADEYIVNGRNSNKGCIYLITNTISLNQYVGLTTRGIEKRFKEHSRANSTIGNAIRKYGEDVFTIEIIKECKDYADLIKSECEMIAKYDTYRNGYNNTTGGDGVRTPVLLDMVLDDKQIKFCKYVEKRNNEEYNPRDVSEMTKSWLLTVIYLYLTSVVKKDKIRVAKMLTRLKPEYVKAISTLNVLDGQEVIDYASQK